MRWGRLWTAYFGRGRRIVFVASEWQDNGAEPQDYEFAQFDESDFRESAIAQMRDRGVQFPLRLREGHRCYGWRGRDGRIASYLWLSDSDAQNPPWMFDLTIAMRPATAYIWDCRTAPGHENRGLYTAGLLKLRRLARDRDVARVLIDCEPDNAPSMRAISKAGFRKALDVNVRRVGPLHLVRINAGRRHVISGSFDPLGLTS